MRQLAMRGSVAASSRSRLLTKARRSSTDARLWIVLAHSTASSASPSSTTDSVANDGNDAEGDKDGSVNEAGGNQASLSQPRNCTSLAPCSSAAGSHCHRGWH